MSKSIEFSKFDDYLLTTIADTVITVKRAQEILTRIGVECSSLNCKIVLLDEKTVKTREVPSHEIMKLSHEMEKLELDKIYMLYSVCYSSPKSDCYFCMRCSKTSG